MKSRRSLLLAALALALAACSGPAYHLLPEPAPAPSRASSVGSIVVADLNLPSYAAAIEIPTLTGPETLQLDKKALWADVPQRALTRSLAQALDDRLSARVSTEPWPGFDAPGLRVEVSVDRMVGSAATGLEFSGQYALVSPTSGRLVALDRFALTVPPTAQDAGLLAVYARAIDALADRIAASVTARGAGA